MRPSLALSIAWRYLFSKKSRGAVTAISTISIVGVAVATAAIVCVLSVFNGFHAIVSDRLDRLEPDVVILPAKGKTIADADSMLQVLKGVKGIGLAAPVIEDNALALYGSREMPVRLKGVDEKAFRKMTAIDSLIISGTPFVLSDTLRGEADLYYDPELQEYIDLQGDSRYMAALSVGVANRLGLQSDDPRILLFAPRRIGRVNLANPISSFLRDSLEVSSVWFSQQADIDKDLVIADIEVARRLFQFTTEATSIEVQGKPGVDDASLAEEIRQAAGPGYIVKDRLQQRELNFRMINIEKWVTFLLLAFILVIASFNILSTLSMLILEKQKSMGVFHAMGMGKNRIGRIFGWESLLVTLLGALGGIILGVGLCLLQEHFGLIKLNGDPSTLIIREYPVKVKALDLLAVLVPIGVIGFFTAWISSAFAKARTAGLGGK